MSLQAMTMVLDFAPQHWNPSKRLVALAVADRINNEQFTWCSYADIQARTGLSRRRVIDLMNQLVVEGIIARETRRRENGSQQSNLWMWLWTLRLGGAVPSTPRVQPVAPPA